MSNYAKNYTGQVQVKYQTGGNEHTWTFRQGRGDGATVRPSLINGIHAWLLIMATFLPQDFAVLGASFIPPDERIALPIDSSGFAVSPSGQAPAGNAWKANALGFVGKTSGGNRANSYIIGVTAIGTTSMFDNYRISAGEWQLLPNAINALNSAGLVGADNSLVTWAPYINIKAMDYWVKELR